MNTNQWLSRLIAFDTTSRNSNLELIHAIQEWFLEHDIVSHLIYDADQPKANLFATLPDKNGNTYGGLILSGHTDVVPVDGQEWDTPPFQATEVGDNIFGRGACDMKGFIAVVLALLPEFKKMQLAYPLHFAFSYDEEIGCLGAPLMIEEIQELGIQAAACLVGEPTDMHPVVAHKGKHSYRCQVHGLAAHSSLTTQGCNAIEYAAELICFLRKMADEYKENGQRDHAYDLPFTTLTTNLIKGGNSYNTLPSLCEFIFEFRHLPQDYPQEIKDKITHYIDEVLLPRMQAEYAEAAIDLKTLAAAPGLDISEEEALTKLCRAITGDQKINKVAYATEAGMFEEAGIPTIVCGPGSIEQAHKANEYVSKAQLAQCEVFLRKLVTSFA